MSAGSAASSSTSSQCLIPSTPLATSVETVMVVGVPGEACCTAAFPPAAADNSREQTMTGAHRSPRATWAPLWLRGLVVALGAAMATAHGLYEVALAAAVPAGIA
jgi:hypothetical protein